MGRLVLAKKHYIISFLICIVGIAILIIRIQYFHIKNGFGNYCDNTLNSKIVSGTSMSPLLSDGQEIQVQTDKNCYTLSRGDIVIYDFAKDLSNANPVVKRVVGKGGDRFAYMSGKISINGEIQKNLSGVEYQIDSNMLALYARDYPIIPPRTLLILGEIPTGSRDSSAFGFISEDEIDGKVILP